MLVNLARVLFSGEARQVQPKSDIESPITILGVNFFISKHFSKDGPPLYTLSPKNRKVHPQKGSNLNFGDRRSSAISTLLNSTGTFGHARCAATR